MCIPEKGLLRSWQKKYPARGFLSFLGSAFASGNWCLGACEVSGVGIEQIAACTVHVRQNDVGFK
ncbi:hypothetical protein ACVIGV_001129 [Rhizobium leguminosarum]